jgi:hypothetical protein
MILFVLLTLLQPFDHVDELLVFDGEGSNLNFEFPLSVLPDLILLTDS